MSNKLKYDKYDKYDNCDIYDDNYDNSTLNKRAIMKAIKNIVVLERLKQREIAELLDIKQPRVSDLLSLKHDRFSLDILMGYLEKFGCVVSFEMNELTNRKTNLVSAKVLRCKTSYRSILPK